MSEQRPPHTDLLLQDQGAGHSGSDSGSKVEQIGQPNKLYPTEEAYSDLLAAFSYFNDKLFGGQLSAPLITLARKPRYAGCLLPEPVSKQIR